MNVLVITGDKRFKEGNPRLELQRGAVDSLTTLFWGRGALFPSIPNKNFDVVTVQDPFWRGLFGVYVAMCIGARLNVQVHTDLSAHSFYRKLLARVVLRKANSVRVVSERIKKQVEEMGVKSRIHVLPVYMDTDVFKSIEQIPHDGKNILWIGRLEREKDPEMAITVFKKNYKEEPSARLIVLGEGSLRRELEKKAQGLPVEFPGWSDTKSYLARADVVISTSPYEGFGASIVEALLAGVPVVSLDVGIAKEAGAIIATPQKLAETVLDVLQRDERGTLKLALPNKGEWVSRWKESL